MKTEKPDFTEQCLLFSGVFTLFIVLARYSSSYTGYITEDLAVRTGQFLDLVFRNPGIKQSIIGSIWFPPLPVIIRAPFALLPFTVNPSFLNNIVSSFFGAGTVLLFNHFIKAWHWDRLSRTFLLFLIVFNPFLLFISITGTDLSVFTFFFTGTVGYFLLWLKDDEMRHFTSMVFFISLMAITKVEGLFYGIILIFSIAVMLFCKKYNYSKKESYLLLSLSPVLYLLFIWSLFNWFIFGDWLYFIRGVPFHISRLSFPETFFAGTLFSLRDIFHYIYIIGAVSLFSGIFKKRISLIFLFFFIIAVPFSVFFTEPDGGYNSVFSLIPVIPVGLFMLLENTSCFCCFKKEGSIKKTRMFLLILLLLSYLFPAPLNIIRREIAGQKKSSVSSEFIQYIREFSTGNRIIVTGYKGYILTYYTGKKDNILHVFDFYTENIYRVKEPSFLLVAEPSAGKDWDGIYSRYKGIDNQGADFTLLEKKIPLWKIYRLIILK